MKKILNLAFVVLATLAVLSCTGKPSDKPVVATVNNSSVLLSELKSELTTHQQQHPGAQLTGDTVDDHLKSIIEKKLMIQEAIKAGITENPAFAETIQRFWEQTLIRELIKTKNREWEASVRATDQDVRTLYDRMRFDVMVSVVRVRDHAAAVDISGRMRRGEAVQNAETLGPLFYDSVKVTPLENAFDMEVGSAEVFPAGSEFIVVRVLKKQSITLPPFASMQDRLRQAATEIKREQAMAVWIDALRRDAKITIDATLAKEVTHEK